MWIGDWYHMQIGYAGAEGNGGAGAERDLSGNAGGIDGARGVAGAADNINNRLISLDAQKC